MIRGIIMVGLLCDDSWCRDFCAGFCVATCTRFGMNAKIAVCGESLFVSALMNAIQCQWYCVTTRWGFDRLGQLTAQCRTHHGQWQWWRLPTYFRVEFSTE